MGTLAALDFKPELTIPSLIDTRCPYALSCAHRLKNLSARLLNRPDVSLRKRLNQS